MTSSGSTLQIEIQEQKYYKAKLADVEKCMFIISLDIML